MRLIFKKVILHNFLSYGHSEISLEDRGFCKIIGENRFKSDNALSNGSGKSTIISAITFAICGETIQGQISDLKNIFIDENECWVKVEFNVDSDHYVLTRYHKPKSDLKIIRNGIEASGKGVRESEAALRELLPDIKMELLSSVVLLGQGMPNKFTSFKPSGRKDLLERLTKSDFMIEDLKTRLVNRRTEIDEAVRRVEDAKLINQTNIFTIELNLTKNKEKLEQRVKPDFERLIKDQEKELAVIKTQKSNLEADYNAQNTIKENANKILLDCSEIKNKQLTESYNKYKKATEELNTAKQQLQNKINEQDFTIRNKQLQINTALSQLKIIEAEITKIRNTPDVCPTCGQKLPEDRKPSTTEQEKRKAELNTEIESLSKEKAEFEKIIVEYRLDLNKITENLTIKAQENEIENKQIEESLKAAIQEARSKVNESTTKMTEIKAKIPNLDSVIKVIENQINRYKYDSEIWDRDTKAIEDNIKAEEIERAELQKAKLELEARHVDLSARVEVLRSLDTKLKRDFRGYLLLNIIKYLNKKAKEFSSVVFGTTDIEIVLNGNDIDINFCGRQYEGLSGGEKTRVDLIIQLAIRSTLQDYLDFHTNLIMLDEVTDFLDKQGCMCIMNLLEQELDTIESVFIISHHSDELGLPIDTEMRITKNEKGISEVQ